jgi:hypothetical protein
VTTSRTWLRVLLFAVTAGGVCLAVGLFALDRFNDVVYSEPDGDPLTHEDFQEDRASLVFRFSDREPSAVRYSFLNETDDERTFAWQELVAITPSGRKVDCWGDDSRLRTSAPPGEWVQAYGGCDVGMEQGTYSFSYQGIVVAELTRQNS